MVVSNYKTLIYTLEIILKPVGQARSAKIITELWFAYMTTYILHKFKGKRNQTRRILSLITFVWSKWVIGACRLYGDNNLQRYLARRLRAWARPERDLRMHHNYISMHAAHKEAQQRNWLEPRARCQEVAKKMPVTLADVTSDFYSV